MAICPIHPGMTTVVDEGNHIRGIDGSLLCWSLTVFPLICRVPLSLGGVTTNCRLVLNGYVVLPFSGRRDRRSIEYCYSAARDYNYLPRTTFVTSGSYIPYRAKGPFSVADKSLLTNVYRFFS